MKKVISVLMAAIFVLSSCSVLAFAYEKGDSVHWNGYTYTFAGDITNEKTNVNVNEELVYCFSAEEAGIYKISTNGGLSIAVSGHIYNEEGYGVKELIENEQTDCDCFYFSMNESETVLLYAYNFSDKAEQLIVEYVGQIESVTQKYPGVYSDNVLGEFFTVESTLLCKLSSGEEFVCEKIFKVNIDEKGEIFNEPIHTNYYIVDVLGCNFFVKITFLNLGKIIVKVDLPDGFVPEYKKPYLENRQGSIPDFIDITYYDGVTQRVILSHDTMEFGDSFHFSHPQYEDLVIQGLFLYGNKEMRIRFNYDYYSGSPFIFSAKETKLETLKLTKSFFVNMFSSIKSFIADVFKLTKNSLSTKLKIDWNYVKTFFNSYVDMEDYVIDILVSLLLYRIK